LGDAAVALGELAEQQEDGAEELGLHGLAVAGGQGPEDVAESAIEIVSDDDADDQPEGAADRKADQAGDDFAKPHGDLDSVVSGGAPGAGRSGAESGMEQLADDDIGAVIDGA